MAFRLFVDSSNGVDVEPEYDFSDSKIKIEDRHRTRSGAEYVYKWGGYVDIKMSVMYVNSEFKSIVNSWWSSNTSLLWMEEGGTQVFSVRLVNNEQPVSDIVKPYTNVFKGTIELKGY